MGKKIKSKKKDKIKPKELKRLKNKGNVIFSLFFIFFLVVFFRVLSLEISKTSHGKNLDLIYKQQLKMFDVIKANRGTIYDVEGNPLAVNVKEYKMTAVLNHKHTTYDMTKYVWKPYYIKDPVADGQKIIKILGYENDEKAKELIMSQIMQDPNEVYEVEFGKYGAAISLEEKNALEEAGIEGLEFQEKENRYYPYGDFSSYTIGYARQYVKENLDEKTAKKYFKENDQGDSVKIVGELGMEKLLNSILEGTDGEQEEILDKQGVPLEEPKVVKQKSDGANVYLTIDSNIQSFVHDYMEKYIKNQVFDNATTVVMDAKTGAILAGEKLPSYDPNLKNVTDYQDPYIDNCFEPGSIIKTFLIAEAIHEGKWNPNETFPTGKRTNLLWGKNNEGFENYVGDWVYNEDGRSWGSITLEQGFYFSSNVGMTYILDDIGYDNWIKTMKEKYEFGEPIENQFYETASCKYDPKYDFEIATTSFGQGMTTNVMQILKGYSTFSGDGRMVNPYLIESIEDYDTGEVIYRGKGDKPINWEVGENGVGYDKKEDLYYKQIITPEENKQVLDLMEGATYYNNGGDFAGTGRSYGKNTKYKIATKTGTAEVSVNGSYDNGSRLFSVVVMAPVEDPKIVIYSSVLNPNTPYPQGYMKLYVGEIIDKTLDYINKETKSDVNYSDTIGDTITVKNYIGMDLKHAKKELSKDKTNYKVIGTGKIQGQYPPVGTKINESMPIYIVASNIKQKDYQNITQEEVANFCLAKNIVCKYKGSGKVKEIKYKEEEKVYEVILEKEE